MLYGGYSSLEFNVPDTMAERAAIASAAKQFTEFAVMILCVIILSNTESLGQNRLGKGITKIMRRRRPPVSRRPKGIPLPQKNLPLFTKRAYTNLIFFGILGNGLSPYRDLI